MLANSGPLRTVSPFLQRSDSSAAVSVRLTEPLWHVGERTELLVHCVQCHMLLEREAALAQDETGELYIEDLCERNLRLRSLLDGLGEAARAVQPGSDPLPLLEETGLSSMCPVVAHLLGDADEVYRNDTVFLPNEYLDHVVTVNQLACTAKQLRRDVLDRQFKYCAHKIALLYHAVNLSKVKRDMLRKRIEEHFEDIKVATESTVRARRARLMPMRWMPRGRRTERRRGPGPAAPACARTRTHNAVHGPTPRRRRRSLGRSSSAGWSSCATRSRRRSARCRRRLSPSWSRCSPCYSRRSPAETAASAVRQRAAG